MAYLGKTPSQAVRSRYYYTATGGETSLSGADDNSNVLTFTDGNYVDVSLNGVALVAGTDYNTTTANTIGGLTALVASDVVEVIVYDTFSVFGGNMAADLNFKDNVKAIFGAGSDLQIYHDGTSNIFAGNIFIDGTDASASIASPAALNLKAGDANNEYSTLRLATSADGSLAMIGAKATTTGAYPNSVGQLELAVQNGASSNTILTATSTGVDVTGTITSDGLTVDTNTLYVDSTNNRVGIGTTSPSAKLQSTTLTGTNAILAVGADTDGFADVEIKSTGSNGASRLYFSDTAAKSGLLRYSHNTDSMEFTTNGTEAMRIDTSGNLLVGQSTTATPGLGNTTTGISVAGQYDLIAASRASGAAMLLNRNTDDGSLIEFSRSGSTVGSIGAYSSRMYIGTGDVGLQFLDAADNILPINPSTPANRDGAIDLGAGTVRFKDLYLSGGVYLGGVGSANYLDDYEEGAGAFTSVTDSGGSAISTNVNIYRYTKIGRFVQLEIRVLLTSATTVEVRLNGLPFTISGYDTQLGKVLYRDAFAAESNQIRLIAGANNQYMYGIVTYYTS